MRIAAVAVAAAVALWALPGCSTECTLVDVEAGLNLTILTPDDLAPATYTLDVVADGETASFTEDRDVEPFLCPGDPACVVELESGLVVELESRPNGFEIHLEADDGTGPAEVTVSIAVDGTAAETVTANPTYVTDEPNGDGCGEITRASEVVEIAQL